MNTNETTGGATADATDTPCHCDECGRAMAFGEAAAVMDDRIACQSCVDEVVDPIEKLFLDVATVLDGGAPDDGPQDLIMMALDLTNDLATAWQDGQLLAHATGAIAGGLDAATHMSRLASGIERLASGVEGFLSDATDDDKIEIRAKCAFLRAASDALVAIKRASNAANKAAR